jgi:hypothetical protein
LVIREIGAFTTSLRLEFEIWDLGFGIWNSGIGIWDLGFALCDLEFEVFPLPAEISMHSTNIEHLDSVSYLVLGRPTGGIMSRGLIVLAAVIGSLFSYHELTSARQSSGIAKIVVRDNGSGLDTLTFGLDLCATRCIDAGLGEQELPPPPPSGVFDARWTDPARQSECMGQGLRRNIHGWPQAVFVDTFKIQFQAGDGDFPMHFNWQTGLTAIFESLRLKDPFGFGIIDVDMLANTNYDLTISAFTSLVIIASGAVPGFARTDSCFSDVHESENERPAAFTLRQNYPNPFNPSTTLQFDVMEHSYVEIEIYDLPGRLVKHLVSQDLTPASYTVAWDGTDNSGHIAASGVYYARMTAIPYSSTQRTESFHATRKLMLVR